MKKLLFVLAASLLLAGCAPAPAAELPPVEGETYTAKLTADLSTLGADPSTAATQVEVQVPGVSLKYKFEIGANTYIKTTTAGFKEMNLKVGAYIKSVSTYTVERITIDFFSKPGTLFNVFAKADGSGDALTYHETSITPTEPDDFGKVYEYQPSSTGWCISRRTDILEKQTPSIYYVSVTFRI